MGILGGGSGGAGGGGAGGGGAGGTAGFGQAVNNFTSATASLNRNLGRELGKSRSLMQQFTNGFAAFTTALREAGKIPDEVAKSIKKDLGSYIDQFEEIRKEYGDLDTLEANRVTAAGSAMRRLETVTNAMFMKQVEVDGVIMSTEELFEKRLGSHTNFLEKNFEQHEAVNLLERSQRALNTQYAQQINNMDSLTMIKIPAYTKGMGLSAEEVGEVMRISILRTGKASTTMLDEVAAYSKSISRETGIPMNFLNKAIASVTTNMRLYGDVTTEEAARIAGNITQLGMKFEDLSATQQKFGKFSSAADHVGKISQITGVQLDAQRISFLSATGKMDEALLYMKDQFRKQGFTKEDFQGMTLPLRNAFADAMIGGQEGVMNLLDMKKPMKDIAEITAKTDISQGFKAVTDNLNQIARYDEDVEKRLEKMRVRAFLPLGRQAHAAAKDIADFKVALGQVDLPASIKKQGMAAQKIFLDFSGASARQLEGHVSNLIEQQARSFFHDMSTAYGLYTQEMADFYVRSGGQDLSMTGFDLDTRTFYDRDPEERFRMQGAYISDAINDANRPLRTETMTLVQTTQSMAQIEEEKRQLYIDAIERHTSTLQEGSRLNMKIKVVDQAGNVLSEEDKQLLKDTRQLFPQRFTLNGRSYEVHYSVVPQ